MEHASLTRVIVKDKSKIVDKIVCQYLACSNHYFASSTYLQTYLGKCGLCLDNFDIISNHALE